MKVLYFHQHFSTPSGSTGIRSYQMARKLVERGHSVTMVCGAYGAGQTGLDGPYRLGRREGVVDGIRIIEIALPYDNALGFLGRVFAFLRFAFRSIWIALREPCDLVFATSTPLTAALPGIAARWLRKKPFVFEVRDLWPELPREMGVIKNPVILWAMGVLEWAAYRSAHRLVALSPGMVGGIARRGVDSSRIMMIPNGCDLDLFSPEPKAERPAGVGQDQLLVVYSGTHGIANGLDAVLDAASVLRQHHRQDIVIMLVGEGKLKRSLQARAQRESLSNVVFRGLMPKSELAGLLSAADVGLQVLSNVPAFYFGTSPNKFFDYLASGLPVLCNYPGWVSEMIDEHRCGFSVAPEDPVGFAEALEYAADHRSDLKRMGAGARQLAESEFNRDELAGQFVEWLEGTCNEH